MENKDKASNGKRLSRKSLDGLAVVAGLFLAISTACTEGAPSTSTSPVGSPKRRPVDYVPVDASMTELCPPRNIPAGSTRSPDPRLTDEEYKKYVEKLAAADKERIRMEAEASREIIARNASQHPVAAKPTTTPDAK